MIHKWLESLFDTIMYIGLTIGLLIFSVFYWRDAYQNHCAELVLEEFLYNAAVSGKMSSEELEGLFQKIQRINTAYEVELAYSSYVLNPCYAKISKEKLDEYYMRRNRRKEVLFSEFELHVEEERPELLHFQTETNASVMAAEGEYLPLPEDEIMLQVDAVRKQQEVYEGEELITVCRVTSESGSYYVEAGGMTVMSSGTIMLEVVVESQVLKVPIEVICYPRLVICMRGHTVVNAKEIVEQWKQSGVIKCPYCAVIPEMLNCNKEVVHKKTGMVLQQDEICLEVVYLDGHTEIIEPGHPEWQDDYDENYCGIQVVSVRYRGKEALFTVVSENKVCEKCGQECNERCFEDYMGFPYCTKCMSEVVLFTGEVHEEEEMVSWGELVAELDEEKEVTWRAGDIITVKLTKGKRVKTLLQKVVKKEGR